MEFGFRSSATCYAFPHKERVCTLGLKKRKRGEMCVLPFLPLIYLGPVLRAERCRQSGRKKGGIGIPSILFFCTSHCELPAETEAGQEERRRERGGGALEAKPRKILLLLLPPVCLVLRERPSCVGLLAPSTYPRRSKQGGMHPYVPSPLRTSVCVRGW